MSTSYYLKCADCNEVMSPFESINNPQRLARIWSNRSLLLDVLELNRKLVKAGMEIGHILIDDGYHFYESDMQFIVDHQAHHVVVHDEYGRDKEMPDPEDDKES